MKAPDVPFFVQTVNEEWHGEEKQHRKQEKDFWRKSLKYTGAAGFAAAVAAGFSIGAFFEARRQAAAAEDANRPWLRPLALIVERTGFQKPNENAYIRADLAIDNVGHSPPVRVYPYTELLLNPYETFNDDYIPKTVCDRARYPSSQYSNVTFPNTVDKVIIVATRDLKDLRSAYDKAFWSKERTFDQLRMAVPLKVVGCLLYVDQSRSVRKSAFVFDLGSLDISEAEPIQSRPLGDVDRGKTYVE